MAIRWLTERNDYEYDILHLAMKYIDRGVPDYLAVEKVISEVQERGINIPTSIIQDIVWQAYEQFYEDEANME